MWANGQRGANDGGTIRPVTTGHGIVKTGWISILTLALALTGAGCAERARTPGPLWERALPTDPLVEKAAAIVATIAGIHSQLAAELGRLPEFGGQALTARHIAALEALLQLCRGEPARFDQAFKQMRSVGRADQRRYCTPLQAFFWLLLDGQHGQAQAIGTAYSLNGLLCAAWPGPALVSATWPQGRIQLRTGLCRARPTAYFLANSLEPADVLLLEQAGHLPGPDTGHLAWTAVGAARRERWSDFETVAERLNAPELIDHFLRSQIRYDYYLGRRKTKAEVVAAGRANCTDNAELAVYLLRRSGYEAEIVTIAGAGPNGDQAHQLVKFSDRGRIFIMDNGRTDPVGIVGPLNSLEGTTFWLNN